MYYNEYIMTSKYTYLVPGNWFELKNINKEKVQPYNRKSLKEEILNQVFNRSENLKIIDITFGQPYKNIKDEDITMYLDREKFNKINKVLQSEMRHPIITFHGTNSLITVESILAEGYIVPGTNKKVKVRNGSMYGNGVYSSPHFDKALAYTRPDESKCVYILINILFLGKAKMISPNVFNKIEDKTIDTKIVFGLDQIISIDENKIIPVGVIKMKIG